MGSASEWRERCAEDTDDVADDASGVRRICDRRSDQRVLLDLTVAAFKDGMPKRYRFVDLSCGGAQIVRGRAEPPPRVHTLEIDLGNGRVMRMLARTVWVSEGRHAVSFLALDDLDRLSIAEGIDRLVALQRNAPRPMLAVS